MKGKCRQLEKMRPFPRDDLSDRQTLRPVSYPAIRGLTPSHGANRGSNDASPPDRLAQPMRVTKKGPVQSWTAKVTLRTLEIIDPRP